MHGTFCQLVRTDLQSSISHAEPAAGNASILRDYMQHAIFVEAMLENSNMQNGKLVARCTEFLDKFPDTPNILLTRGMAFNKQRRYHALS